MTEEIKKPVKRIASLLRKGSPIQIIVRGDGREFIYSSSIIKFDEKTFFLTPPKINKEELIVDPNQKILFSYRGADALYQFYSTVRGIVEKEHGIRQFEFRIPEQGWRIQRRNYFRVPLGRDGFIRTARSLGGGTDAEIDPEAEWEKCYIANISGGGVAFIANIYLQNESFGELRFKLEPQDADFIEEIVKVVRLRMVKNTVGKTTYQYAYGVFFVKIMERERDRIVRFVHGKQQDIVRRNKHKEK